MILLATFEAGTIKPRGEERPKFPSRFYVAPNERKPVTLEDLKKIQDIQLVLREEQEALKQTTTTQAEEIARLKNELEKVKKNKEPKRVAEISVVDALQTSMDINMNNQRKRTQDDAPPIESPTFKKKKSEDNLAAQIPGTPRDIPQNTSFGGGEPVTPNRQLKLSASDEFGGYVMATRETPTSKQGNTESEENVATTAATEQKPRAKRSYFPSSIWPFGSS